MRTGPAERSMGTVGILPHLILAGSKGGWGRLRPPHITRMVIFAYNLLLPALFLSNGLAKAVCLYLNGLATVCPG